MTAGSAGAPRVARVVLDSPLPQLDRVFDYAIPEALAESARPGVRVRVPVRAARRILDGFIVELAERSEFGGALAELEAVISPVRVLGDEVWALARRVADRAAGAASDVLRLAVPKRQARVEQAWATAVRASADDTANRGAASDEDTAGRGAASGGVSRPTPGDPAPRIPGYPDRLGTAIDAGTRLVVPAIPEPAAWAATIAAMVARVVAGGRSAIVAVPDLRDLQRLRGALAAAIGADQVLRLDAEQTAAARYRAFLDAGVREGVAIIGTRSVVYAPAVRLGLIAIWDDGDPGYQEPLAPHVHARDAALIRQELAGCALALLAHSPSTEAQRLVELGWCERVAHTRRTPPRVIPTALQTGGDRLAEHARIPSSAWRAAADAIAIGPVLVQVARPGDDASSGSERTAAELGRSFPQARVVLADGSHPIDEVGAEAALVVATRGAEPLAVGGYRAVLLLDGERMLARESLRVTEDALRTWSNAIALGAPGSPSYLVGVGGAVAAALAGWRQPDIVSAELAERHALRFPPAVRSATLTGSPGAVDAAIAAAGIPPSDVIAPVEEADGLVRLVIRFDYRRGTEVAAALRIEIVRHAAGHRTARKGQPLRAPELRVRMDDPEPFIGERAGVGRMER